jgi:hypothetical protein
VVEVVVLDGHLLPDNLVDLVVVQRPLGLEDQQ